MKKFFKSFFLTLLAFLFACPAGLITYAQEKVTTSVNLEETPIDVVYCYADLWDHTLKRGDPELNNSIKKDYDNQELKYSLRSVLKNIPWVRKIFIIMPNDKVRFLKEPDEIKDRIVYVKNEDLLGFDTNSPHVKHLHMWRLKEKFGCSNHIICMDDDNFIGKPMKKSDFFYIENDKIVSYAFSDSVYISNGKPNIKVIQLNSIEKQFKNLKNPNGGHHPEANSGALFNYLVCYEFLIKNAFNRSSLQLPGKGNQFHFPYPINLNELEELYKIAETSRFKQSSLYGKRRMNGTLMTEIIYPYYIFNKYARKVRKPSTNYIAIEKCNTANFNVELFVINNEGHKYLTYIDATYRNARNTMKRLFPEPTPYEIPNCKLDIFDFEDGKPAPAKSVNHTPRLHKNPGRRR